MTVTLNLRRSIDTAKYMTRWNLYEYKRTGVGIHLSDACNETCKALRLIKLLKELP